MQLPLASDAWFLILAFKASLNGSFMEGFVTLNIFTFADMVRREKDGVS